MYSLDTTDNFPIDSNINGEDHGALVRDILDTKNTIENAATRKVAPLINFKLK